MFPIVITSTACNESWFKKVDFTEFVALITKRDVDNEMEDWKNLFKFYPNLKIVGVILDDSYSFSNYIGHEDQFRQIIYVAKYLYQHANEGIFPVALSVGTLYNTDTALINSISSSVSATLLFSQLRFCLMDTIYHPRLDRSLKDDLAPAVDIADACCIKADYPVKSCFSMANAVSTMRLYDLLHMSIDTKSGVAGNIDLRDIMNLYARNCLVTTIGFSTEYGITSDSYRCGFKESRLEWLKKQYAIMREIFKIGRPDGIPIRNVWIDVRDSDEDNRPELLSTINVVKSMFSLA